MLIEFAFGMLIGLATVRGKFIPERIAVALLLTSLAVLGLNNFSEVAGSYQYRIWIWGVPGAILLASVVSLEGRLKAGNIRPLVKLGDASYSLYLIHALIIGAVWAVAAKVVPMNALVGTVMYLLAIVASVLVAWVTYQFVELPVTTRLSKWLVARRPAPTGV